jgi:hypothetical protein
MAQAKGKQNLHFPDSFFLSSFFPSLSFPVFYITESDFGQTFYAETYKTLDEACNFLNMLELSQEDSYSFQRELSIAELKSQIVDFMTENQEF